MKIDAPLSFPENRPPEKVERAGSSVGQKRSSRTSTARDEARLSIDQDKVETLKSELSRLPEVRQERVEVVKQAVREGRQQVSDQQLAEAIHSEWVAQTSRLR
jgi:flagellar biosynthesis anti-sigma factor FlgM